MPMQDDNDFYIQTINSDIETDSVVDGIPYHNTDDDSNNGTLNAQPTGTLDDEKEESIMLTSMSGLQNKWIFIRMDQKSQLEKKIILLILTA